MIGSQTGLRGGFNNVIPASAGVLLAFLLLHPLQQTTKFSQQDCPPLDLGITWSIVMSNPLTLFPQY
jgi:hypothetical protein